MTEVCPVDCSHTPGEVRRILRRKQWEEEHGPIDWSDPMVQAMGHPEDYR